MKLIQLYNSGFFSLVDDEDFDLLNQKTWYSIQKGNTFYVYRRERKNGICKTIFMHRFIMNTPEGLDVDHVNHLGWDNRKCNLRNCTRKDNLRNRSKVKSASSYIGVSLLKLKNRIAYRAKIRINGKSTHLGVFNSEIEAAQCYDMNAKKYYGEYANLNFK